MYERVAETDSDGVFLGLAPDDEQQSLMIESASSASIFGGQVGSTTLACTASTSKRGSGVDRLPVRSKSPRTGPSRRPSPSRCPAASRLCLPDIPGREAPHIEPTGYTSSPQVEFLLPETAQEIG
jgi:hypothetical protein